MFSLMANIQWHQSHINYKPNQTNQTMKTYKQQLIDEPKKYTNDDHLLECFFSEELRFCLMFNAKLFTYKTWNGFLTKRTYFIQKYNLLETKPNQI